MTAPRDPDRLIDAFLAEGQTDLPDRVYDEVRAEIEHTGQRTIFGPWNSPAFLRFGALAATAAVVALAVVIGLQLPSNAPGGPGPAPVGVSDSVTSGDFRLTISSPSGTWGSDEAIEVEATLEYLGNAAETTIWGSGSGPIGFSVVEVSGDREMGGAFTADCASHVIGAGQPITTPFQKSGGYSPDEPNATFYASFFADPVFRLPAGEWQVTASATFDDGETCTASPIQMAATITLTIEGSAEPSVEPTAPPEPSLTPEPSIGAVEPPFTCDLPITLAAAGTDFHPLITQDIRVGTHGDFDRIVFEYDGGTPSLDLDLAQPPYVQDPSGLPQEVAGSPVYRITLIGATKYDQENGEQPYQGPTDFEPGFPQIVQFVEFGDFEATHNWYLGVNGAQCLRAFTLLDPDRLVIDIQHVPGD
jgi:hypothetical protein